MFIHTLTPFLLQLEGLGPVCRTKGVCKRPRKSVWGSKDGHGVPEMEVKGFGWVHCEEPEMSVKDLRLV